MVERFLLNYLEPKVFLHGQVLTPRGVNYHGKTGPREKGDMESCPIFFNCGPEGQGLVLEGDSCIVGHRIKNSRAQVQNPLQALEVKLEDKESRTRLSDFTFTFHFHALEKEMATHSSVLAWRIPGTRGPGGLPSGVAQSWTLLKRLSSSSSSKMKEIITFRNETTSCKERFSV